ncbi:MAG: UDP-N-acetylmuramoyl-L-alanine--D-glutamate ligase [Candidatus Sericytochromatia bacterium]|nr:UDP-N-acetylmuramoyl-L-alanine--D-glutamate ligase [Candidatus Sericytochromatia bacterium]
MDWQNKTVTILGLGRSGLACAKVLSGLGCELILSDTRSNDVLEPLVRAELGRDFRVDGGGHSSACLDADVLVVSPGVPVDLPIVQAALADGVPVLGEIEVAFQLRPHTPYIAITGSNGKTTTTTLVGEILRSAGVQTLVGGNIGTPLVSFVAEPAEAIVAEVSSFQLETISTFRPKVAAILNLSDDHLNRHGTRDAYWRAKCRIFENQTPDDWAVLNADDPTVYSLSGTLQGRELLFSARRPLGRGVCVVDDWIVLNSDGGSVSVMPVAEVPLRGQHNLENVLAAVAIAAALGLRVEPVREAIAKFRGVEHRIELLPAADGVLWVNDSKGTNYDATVKAIAAFSEPIILIAGGRDKGGDMAPLLQAICERVQHVVLLGEAAPLFDKALRQSGFDRIFQAESLKDAVMFAQDRSKAGDVVLFSPACTSFDMFKDYEDRGRAFKSIVNSLGIRPDSSAS